MSPASCHLFVVVGWGIVYLNDPDSYAGWSFYTPGRATQARQVEGQRSEKVAAQSLLFLFTFLFFSLLLSFYSTFISPISVLFSSVYNIFTLLGRKAPFTHSLIIN